MCYCLEKENSIMKSLKNSTAGHIREIKGKNGMSYQLVWYKIDLATGKTVRQYKTFKPQKDAEKFLAYVTKNFRRDGLPIYDKRSLGEFLDDYLNSREKEGDLSPTTIEGYRCDVKNRLKPYIGGIRVPDLSPRHIRQWFGQMQEDGLSAKSIQNVYRLLHCAYEYAIENDIVEKNPCKPKPPTVKKKPLEVYTEEEIKDILAKAKDTNAYLMLIILFNTGLRRGELLGLRWSDIDLDKKTLIVQHNLVIADGKVYEKEPKSESGKREIPLADALVQVLKEARDKDIEAFDEERASTGYVIHLPDGDPYMPDSISQKWARFAKSNGIRYLSLHDIRHTVASQMIHKNVNCKVVQAIMGHADIKVTLDTYVHPYKEDEKAAIDALSEVTFTGTAEAESKPVLPPMDDSSSMTI